MADRWAVAQGIQSGADAYSARVQRRLSERTRSELAARGHQTGDPIMELPPGAEQKPPWSDYPQFLAHSPESRAVLVHGMAIHDLCNLSARRAVAGDS